MLCSHFVQVDQQRVQRQTILPWRQRFTLVNPNAPFRRGSREAVAHAYSDVAVDINRLQEGEQPIRVFNAHGVISLAHEFRRDPWESPLDVGVDQIKRQALKFQPLHNGNEHDQCLVAPPMLARIKELLAVQPARGRCRRWLVRGSTVSSLCCLHPGSHPRCSQFKKALKQADGAPRAETLCSIRFWYEGNGDFQPLCRAFLILNEAVDQEQVDKTMFPGHCPKVAVRQPRYPRGRVSRLTTKQRLKVIDRHGLQHFRKIHSLHIV